MPKIIECIPNFSEGRNPATVQALAAAVESVPGVRLLDRTSDADHHRSVLTFAGDPDAVAEAAFHAIRLATALILAGATLAGYFITCIAYPAPLLSRDQALGRMLGMPLAEAQRIQALVPGATLARMPGVGHLPPMEAPDAFASVLADFLTSLEG